jgi:hypothetical protein
MFCSIFWCFGLHYAVLREAFIPPHPEKGKKNFVLGTYIFVCLANTQKTLLMEIYVKRLIFMDIKKYSTSVIGRNNIWLIGRTQNQQWVYYQLEFGLINI